jgi:glycosyltransferase involved in cell wall biosynthesis
VKEPGVASGLIVVIPAYNEAATIGELVSVTRRYAEVCVVDDGSTDETPEILARLPGIHRIRHQRNTHIAGAILDGMRYAFEAGYAFCITMDAGMSHDPHAIPLFQARADADLVMGYRQERVNVPLRRRALSRAANILMNLALNGRGLPARGAGFRDVTSGYRMYSRDAVGLLLRRKMKSRSFDFHLEALAHVYLTGMKIAEIPIVYTGSNSSLSSRAIGDALRTWWRVCVRDEYQPSTGSECAWGKRSAP